MIRDKKTKEIKDTRFYSIDKTEEEILQIVNEMNHTTEKVVHHEYIKDPDMIAVIKICEENKSRKQIDNLSDQLDEIIEACNQAKEEVADLMKALKENKNASN